MGELVKLSKISQFTAKRHCLQTLYKCTCAGEEELLYSAAQRADEGSYYHNRERAGELCKGNFLGLFLEESNPDPQKKRLPLQVSSEHHFLSAYYQTTLTAGHTHL